MFNENSISKDSKRSSISLLRTTEDSKLSESDNLLRQDGLAYCFADLACQPKSTVAFDSFAISDCKSTLIFGHINDQSEYHREWWENLHIEIMIIALFRTKTGKTQETL